MAAFWPEGAALWLWAGGVSLFPVLLIALGAVRDGSGLGPLRLPLALLAAVLVGSLALFLLLPDGGPAVVFGLPLGTAWILFVLVPVPLAIVAWAYASVFDRFWLRDEDLERIHRLRSEGPGSPEGGR